MTPEAVHKILEPLLAATGLLVLMLAGAAALLVRHGARERRAEDQPSE